jgi:excisionase family DNA binding protein
VSRDHERVSSNQPSAVREDARGPRLLTLAEVAAYLQLSQKTVRRLRIPCVRLGRSVRFRPSDVERFLAARRFHA